jgi:hypothetical protein
MPTDITQSTIVATIPAANDAADIVTAFTAYHTDIGAAINLKSNIASPIFSGNVTAPNLLATTGVTAPTITSNTAHANVHTITLVGQASSAVKAARYYPAANVSYDPNSATVNQTRIIVSQNTPNTASLQAGDVWISWTV